MGARRRSSAPPSSPSADPEAAAYSTRRSLHLDLPVEMVQLDESPSSAVQRALPGRSVRPDGDFGRQQALDGEYRRFLEDGTPKVSPRDQAGHCGDPRIEAAVHRSLHYPRVPRHPRGPHERSQSRHRGGRRSRDASTRRHPYQFPERACVVPDDPNTDAIAVELSVGARLTVVNCYVPPNRRGGWDKIGSDPESGVVCVRCGLRSDWLASRVLLFVVLIVLEPPLPRLDIGWPSSGQMCRLGPGLAFL